MSRELIMCFSEQREVDGLLIGLSLWGNVLVAKGTTATHNNKSTVR